MVLYQFPELFNYNYIFKKKLFYRVFSSVRFVLENLHRRNGQLISELNDRASKPLTQREAFVKRFY